MVRTLVVVLPILACAGCGVGGSPSGPAASGRDGTTPSTPSTDLQWQPDYPRLTLRGAGGGSTNSVVTLDMAVWGSSGEPVPYEIVVDGASRGLASMTLSPSGWSPASWEIGPGRHRVEVRLDPANTVAETDETNNDALIIVDVPVASAPTPVDGTDLAFAYPPYPVFTPLPPLNRLGGDYWSCMVNVPVGNNGTTHVGQIEFRSEGAFPGTVTDTGDYAPGALAMDGIGRGVPALAPEHVVLTIDSDGILPEVDEGNNSFTLDFVTPPAEGPAGNG